jgi:hypothetical protein
MTRQILTQRAAWTFVVLAAALAALLLGIGATDRDPSGPAPAGESEPAAIEPIAGTELMRVRLTTSAAQRIGLETARVESTGGRKVVPYSAILYDERGRTWVYTSPARLTFVRAPVAVAEIRGPDAILSSGPPVRTEVASVAAAELYGTEFEVDH